MTELPTRVELYPADVDELKTLLGRLDLQIRFPRMRRLIDHIGSKFLFLDGPDSFQLPDEITELQWENRKIPDALGKKLDDIRKIAAFHSIRLVIARRLDKQRPLSVSVIEKLPDGGGLSEEAQSDLSIALGSPPHEFRFLQEMTPATGYPEAETVLDQEGTKEFVTQMERLLSDDNLKSGRVTTILADELRDISLILQRAKKEDLYVWLSRA